MNESAGDALPPIEKDAPLADGSVGTLRAQNAALVRALAACEQQLVQALAVKESLVKKMTQAMERLAQAKTDRDILTKKIMQLEGREAEGRAGLEAAARRAAVDAEESEQRVASLEKQLSATRALVAGNATETAGELERLAGENAALRARLRDAEDRLASSAVSAPSAGADKDATRRLRQTEAALQQARIDRQVVVRKLLVLEHAAARARDAEEARGARERALLEEIGALKLARDAAARRASEAEALVGRATVSGEQVAEEGMRRLEATAARVAAERDELQRRLRAALLPEEQGRIRDPADPLDRAAQELRELDGALQRAREAAADLAEKMGLEEHAVAAEELKARFEALDIVRLNLLIALRDVRGTTEGALREAEAARGELRDARAMLGKQVLNLEHELTVLRAEGKFVASMSSSVIPPHVQAMARSTAAQPEVLDVGKDETLLRALREAEAALTEAREDRDAARRELQQQRAAMQARVSQLERAVLASRLEADFASKQTQVGSVEAGHDKLRPGADEQEVMLAVLAKELRQKEAELHATRTSGATHSEEEAAHMAAHISELEEKLAGAMKEVATARAELAVLGELRVEHDRLKGRLRDLVASKQVAAGDMASESEHDRGTHLDFADFPAVVSHARYLGIDPIYDAPYLWIAEQALNAPLPDGWSEHVDATGRTYYYNANTDASIWEHPLDDYFRFLFQQLRERGSEGGQQIEEFTHTAGATLAIQFGSALSRQQIGARVAPPNRPAPEYRRPESRASKVVVP